MAKTKYYKATQTRPAIFRYDLDINELHALQMICNDWRQLVIHSNLHSGPECHSERIEDYISNVLQVDKIAGRVLSRAEALCDEIL